MLIAFLRGIDLGLLVGYFKVVECPCVVDRIRLVLSAATYFYFTIPMFVSAYALCYDIRVVIIVLFVGIGYRCHC